MADEAKTITPGEAIDTGTGGFPVDGKVQTYDVGVVSSEPSKTPYSPGKVSVDSSVRDVSDGTKKTLGAYLSDTTLGRTPSSGAPVPNRYPVKHDPSRLPGVVSLHTEKGHVPPITVVSDEQPHFSDILPGRSNDSVSLNILRGREEPTSSRKVDGHALLSTAAPRDPGAPDPPPPGSVNTTLLEASSPVRPYTDRVLSKNLYGESDPYSVANEALPRPPETLYTSPVTGPRAEDISPARKKTFADYLGNLTREGPKPLGGNTFPITVNQVNTATLLDEKGQPVSPNSSPSSRTNFVEDGVLSSRSTAATRLDIGRGRSRTVDPRVDGHWLLRNATAEVINANPLNPSADGGKLPAIGTSELVSKEIKEYYGDPKSLSTSLIYNRFNPSDQFTPPDDVERGGGGSPSSRLARRYFAKKYPAGRSLGPDDPTRDVTYGRLAQIGNSLMLRATREIGAFDSGNPTGGKAEANALLPGSAQLGLARSTSDELTAGSVLDVLTTTDINENLLIDPAGKSWGALNNPLDQFSGISSFGMQLLAAALLIALSIAITVFSLIFMIGSGGTQIEDPADPVGRLPLGSSQKVKSANYGSVSGLASAIISGNFDFWSMVGVSPTYNEKSRCLPVGALSFFGVRGDAASTASPGTMAFLAATQGLAAATQSPGYYSIMARNVNRSLLTIGDAFINLGKSFGNFFGNPVAAAKQLLGIIEVLRDSKLMKFVNIFCKLGDMILVDKAKQTAIQIKDVAGRSLGQLDISDTQLSVQRNRLAYSKKLSWASFRAPDMLLMSPTFKNSLLTTKLSTPTMSTTIQKAGSYFDNGLRTNSVYNASKDGRISTEDRERLEDFLEAEYVPFYIHDIRTNEIVSFHAFLTSLSDGYTATYDSADGFGRVEPIKTYKNTSRKMDFSFMLAATDTDDFNSMWLKINKLTTLVYPQFSEGRALIDKSGQNRLHAPFSQVIQASPLVRVRIGDLVKSNYSRFNLSRLFGYGEPDTKLMGSTPLKNSAYIDSSIEEKKYEEAYVVGNTFVTSREFVWDKPGFVNSGKLPECFVLKIERIETSTDSQDYFCRIEIVKGDDIPQKYSSNVAALDAEANFYYQNILENVPLKMKKNELRPSPSTLKKIKSAVMANAKDASYHDEFAAFMNDDPNSKDGNAIVKSFRTAGGKGLAGFIESLSFDWYDRVTWETSEVSKRAPKMCKVSISFSPIHDIAPGLDHNGMNRAPVYPVGPMWTNDFRTTPKK